jgi:hypothetical protein
LVISDFWWGFILGMGALAALIVLTTYGRGS